MLINYRCSEGHEVGAAQELSVCPGCDRRGKPCSGDLVRVGAGSRKRVHVVEGRREVRQMSQKRERSLFDA